MTPEVRETLLSQYTTQLTRARQWTDIIEVLSSPIAIGLWIAAIAGFVAPMFMRGLLQKPQRITD